VILRIYKARLNRSAQRPRDIFGAKQMPRRVVAPRVSDTEGDVIGKVNAGRLTADSWAVRASPIAAGEPVRLRVRRDARERAHRQSKTFGGGWVGCTGDDRNLAHLTGSEVVRAVYGAQREGRGVLALVRGNTHRVVVLEP
jgi:hypothetical protein